MTTTSIVVLLVVGALVGAALLTIISIAALFLQYPAR